MAVERKTPGAKQRTTVAQPRAQQPPSQGATPANVLPRPQAVLLRAQADPSLLSPAEVDVLQRTIGLRAARRMVGIPSPFAASIQAKLTVGPAGDQYEQEADRVAKQVVARRAPCLSAGSAPVR